MLNKALERVKKETTSKVSIIKSDVRELDEVENKYKIILAGSVLHHLRDYDWLMVF